jgi:S-adenosylmethionine-dependent methyltransferase
MPPGRPAERAPDRLAERPHERRAAARTAVVWQALEQAVGARTDLEVLDVGGGTGGFAVGIAERGHRVTVVDPSPDALATLTRRARERGVEARVRGVQGDLSDLSDLGAELPGGVDLVLCHGVLEVVTDPAEALRALRTRLRPDGVLSLLVAQRYAAVLARAMAGHLGQAREMLDPVAVPDGAAGRARRYTADELRALAGPAGLDVLSVHGVRVFADLVPGALLDAEPGALDALADLERAAASVPELLPLATQLHLLATATVDGS